VPVWIQVLGYIFALAGAGVHTLSRNWNRTLIGFAVQSLGAGMIAAQIAPVPMAITKCVVGWLSAALVAITLAREGAPDARAASRRPMAVFFRAALLLLVWSAFLSLLPEFSPVFRRPPYNLLALSVLLIGAGLIGLGLSEHACRVALALLTVLQGFELGYLWMEQSLLVIGLLAAADLAAVLALVALYTYSLPQEPEGPAS
jgi:hypothetical protein